MQIGDILASKGMTIRGEKVVHTRKVATSIIKSKCVRSDNISRPQKPSNNNNLGDDSSPRRKPPTTMAEYYDRYPGIKRLGIRGNFDSITTKAGI